jgi:hypothetical protein
MVLRAPVAGSKAETKALTDSQRIVQAAVKMSDTVINAQTAPLATEVAKSVPAPAPPPAAPVLSPAPAVAAARAATAMPGGQGTIQILSGPNAGKELPLLKPLTTLGKPGVQVAVIAKRPQGHYITHVEGANFPVVNGKVLDAQAHQLNDHDIIELAGVKMEFFLKS